MKTSIRVLCLGSLLAVSAVAGAQTYGPKDEGRRFNDGSKVVCHNVEVQRNSKDPNRITGTATGAVVGGLLGNQVGGGNGKTAMTVLGAAGGAFAGNKIEQNMKKVTVYQVRVRMNDGSTRNVEVSSSVPVGSRVIVEGNNLRMA